MTLLQRCAKAEDAPVFVKYNKKNDVAYMDITGGYGIEGLSKVERTFYFGEKEIIVKSK